MTSKVMFVLATPALPVPLKGNWATIVKMAQSFTDAGHAVTIAKEGDLK